MTGMEDEIRMLGNATLLLGFVLLSLRAAVAVLTAPVLFEGVGRFFQPQWKREAEFLAKSIPTGGPWS